jgi:hypothetical protein
MLNLKDNLYRTWHKVTQTDGRTNGRMCPPNKACSFYFVKKAWTRAWNWLTRNNSAGVLSTHYVYMGLLQFLGNNCACVYVSGSYHTEYNVATCSTTFQVRDNVLLWGLRAHAPLKQKKIYILTWMLMCRLGSWRVKLLTILMLRTRYIELKCTGTRMVLICSIVSGRLLSCHLFAL